MPASNLPVSSSSKRRNQKLPESHLTAINELQESLAVSAEQLKAITQGLTGEIKKSLAQDEGSVSIRPSWIFQIPNGDERGEYTIVDMTSSHLRICIVDLLDNKGDFDISQSNYKIAQDLKPGSDVWEYIADSVAEFHKLHHHDGKSQQHENYAGLTFNDPVSLENVNEGYLQTWTRGYDIGKFEGVEVAQKLEAALAKEKLPVTLSVVVSDTVGMLLASAYTDPAVRMSVMFGTGSSGAYFEDCGALSKCSNLSSLDPKTPLAVMCNWNDFDDDHKVLPKSKFDVALDKQSATPGKLAFEKLTAGPYQAELFRLILIDLCGGKSLIFKGQDLSKLRKPSALDAAFLGKIEADPFTNLFETQEAFESHLGITPNTHELILIRTIAELISTRAARLSASAVAAMCKRKGMTQCSVATDGSLLNKYPHFRERLAMALAEIFEWPESRKSDPIKLVPGEDGNGVGTALAAALTREHIKKGEKVGVRTK